MEGPFSFETLSAQDALEKKSRALTRLEASFFRYMASYLGNLEAEYRKENDKNPSSKRAAFLGDELRNATNKAEELWKSREKKLVAFAQVNARKDPPPPPPENLTRDESEFYHGCVALFRQQWQRMLPVRATHEVPVPPASPRPPASSPAPSAAGSALKPPAAPALSPAPTATTAATNSGKDEVQTIRALVDIPPFVGFDGKTYRIKKGDVLSLPKKFAVILKDRNQANLVG